MSTLSDSRTRDFELNNLRLPGSCFRVRISISFWRGAGLSNLNLSDVHLLLNNLFCRPQVYPGKKTKAQPLLLPAIWGRASELHWHEVRSSGSQDGAGLHSEEVQV